MKTQSFTRSPFETSILPPAAITFIGRCADKGMKFAVVWRYLTETTSLRDNLRAAAFELWLDATFQRDVLSKSPLQTVQ